MVWGMTKLGIFALFLDYQVYLIGEKADAGPKKDQPREGKNTDQTKRAGCPQGNKRGSFGREQAGDCGNSPGKHARPESACPFRRRLAGCAESGQAGKKPREQWLERRRGVAARTNEGSAVLGMTERRKMWGGKGRKKMQACWRRVEGDGRGKEERRGGEERFGGGVVCGGE